MKRECDVAERIPQRTPDRAGNERDNCQQKKQIDALSAGLQKVSAQPETRKPAAKVVVGDQ